MGNEEKEVAEGANSISITSDATSLPSQPTDAQVYTACVHSGNCVRFGCVCLLQYSTPDSIRQDMIQYERITLEAAAQVRQKWTEET